VDFNALFRDTVRLMYLSIRMQGLRKCKTKPESGLERGTSGIVY
jgi:hypothetical protein